MATSTRSTLPWGAAALAGLVAFASSQACSDDSPGGLGNDAIPAGLSPLPIVSGATLESGPSPGALSVVGVTASGSRWRVVWTGDGGAQAQSTRFQGSIWTPGTFSNVVKGCAADACALETDDVIASPVAATGGGERIDFDTRSLDGLDGLEFSVSEGPVTFDVRIDGVRLPLRVAFPTGDEAMPYTGHPEQIPFALASTSSTF